MRRIDIFRPVTELGSHKWLRPYTIGKAESYLPRISVQAARLNIMLVRQNPLNVPARKLLAQQFAQGAGAPLDVGEAEWLRLTVDRSEATVQRILHDCDEAERVVNMFAPLFGEYLPAYDWLACWCQAEQWPVLFGPHRGKPMSRKVPVNSVPCALIYKRVGDNFVLHDSYLVQASAQGMVPATFCFNRKTQVRKAVPVSEFRLPAKHHLVAVYGYLVGDAPNWLSLCAAQDLDRDLTIYEYRDEEAAAAWDRHNKFVHVLARATAYCKRKRTDPAKLKKAKAIVARAGAEHAAWEAQKKRISQMQQIHTLQLHALDAFVLDGNKWVAVATNHGAPPASISVFGQCQQAHTVVQCVVSAPNRTWRTLC